MTTVSLRTKWNDACSFASFGAYFNDEVIDPKTGRAKPAGLKNSRGYKIAKSGGPRISLKEQIQAAEEIIDGMLFEKGKPTSFYAMIRNQLAAHPDCLILAPSLSTRKPKNVLAITFAHIIATEFDREVCETIFEQPKDASRRGMDGTERLGHDTHFFGDIEKNRKYFIVDDVLTMGGTVASLKGYIETGGGKVCGVSVLADGTSHLDRRAHPAKGIPLKPLENDLQLMKKLFGNEERLDRILRSTTGHGLEEITAREADFIIKNFHGNTNALRNALISRIHT